eukprot:TRINITY_DN1559_c0_g1_i1.p1 TRINITY_DN1559_c0_g1~~TRINITY_DN1559_c0_g1_i1.p1  ORF type:complete len:201 (-),score=34.82 TRINITY_DN1559_c0_g1_i1:12-614(-)
MNPIDENVLKQLLQNPQLISTALPHAIKLLSSPHQDSKELLSGLEVPPQPSELETVTKHVLGTPFIQALLSSSLPLFLQQTKLQETLNQCAQNVYKNSSPTPKPTPIATSTNHTNNSLYPDLDGNASPTPLSQGWFREVQNSGPEAVPELKPQEPQSKYETELSYLKECGYEDAILLRNLLNKCSGDVNSVLDRMLNNLE